MSATVNYPEAFLDRMKNVLGDEFEAFVQSLDCPSPTSIRLNPRKTVADIIYTNTEQIPWCENGRYLSERPSFTFDPLFHAGAYYVQEASSMFVEEIWKQINPENKTVKVLDLCAAPGGKSTHLLSLMNEKSLLVSNELIPNRNKILQQNITKWGTANCIITQNKPEDFAALEDYFDIILIDAPCSGEGLFRKDKNAIDEWSEKNVALCAVRQKDILEQAVNALKPGGFLIYSTCTFEAVENDERISDYGLQIADVEIQNSGQVKTNYGYQFYPHKVKGEGFYISVMKKETTDDKSQKIDTRHKTQDTRQKTAVHFLQNPDQFVEHTKNEFLFAIPQHLYADFLFLEKQLYIRQAGIFMGTVKGKDFLPSQDLALSNSIKTDLPSVELNYEEAISFLRCETPKLKTENRGWCLATFKGLNLGWMKVMDGRINNYFQKEWRILKQA